MPTRKRHAIELAVCFAVMMHLLLFMAVRPVNGNGLVGAPVPPETHYLAKPFGQLPASGSSIRAIWSPLLFSLPSEMGFSRALLQEKLRTRLTFRQPDEPESFLEIDPVSRNTGVKFDPQDLMLTTGKSAAPRPPSGASQPLETRPAPRRVYMVPELKERLVGGVVLPPELNKTAEAWAIRADMRISKEGVVQHVFLEHPQESTQLNQSIIQTLHGLRFKPGAAPVEGRIEIYSPETIPGEGASQ